ncbi:lef-7 [Trichoplusia ni granulovirus LBIV-12]|uniref:Lef-7 n=1 Tax=Trichoplusia ni granulovirus LBIV-12 TaxID=1916701 RepID=A0A1D8QLD3_GVTN|nr:lef-7 [Trichoplusia ni granulovirus LBIV-12]AOW41461.1 lef-7 [Trichoplusia ni granulovirus LBIV-12]
MTVCTISTPTKLTMKRMNVFENKATPSKTRCLTQEDTDQVEILDKENTNKLPVELKLQIIEFLGGDTYAEVTGDHNRADTLLLQKRDYKKYFDSRSLDYCILEDTKLARCIKNCTGAQLTRLPMLAERQFLTYFNSQPEFYNVTEDPLLDTYFGNVDRSRLPMLVYGHFDDYKKSMTDDYDPSNDRLLMTFLGISAQNVVQCLNRLIKLDQTIKRVRAAHGAGSKLFLMQTMYTAALYKYFREQNITAPECFQPLNLRKILSACTELLESHSLEIKCVCDTCGEKAISAATGTPIMNYGSWEDLRVIVFCSTCASCLLRIPM